MYPTHQRNKSDNANQLQNKADICSQDDISMHMNIHKKKSDLDLLRVGKRHITILLQISGFNPKLTCICPQIHYVLILILIKTSLKRLGPGCDSSLLEIFLDQEDFPIKNNLFPCSQCRSLPISPGFQKPPKT